MKHCYRYLCLILASLMLTLTACTAAPLPPEDDATPPPLTNTTNDTPPKAPENAPSQEQEPPQGKEEDTRSAAEKMTDEEIDDLINSLPALLARYGDTDRLAILRRYIDKQLQDKASTAVLSDMSVDLYFSFWVGSEEDRFGFRNYYLLSSHQTPAPGEPEYLVLNYNVSGKLIGTTVQYADEELTLPATAPDYFAVNSSLERLNILLEKLAPNDPMGYLREVWAKEYIGTRDGIDYYITTPKETKDGLEMYNIRGLQRTMQHSPLVKIAPGSGTDVTIKEGVLPIAASTPAVVAAQPEAQRLAYLQALANEDGFYFSPTNLTLRQRTAEFWGSHMIGAEVDRDYFALQPITDRDRYNGTQLDALVIIFHDDGSVKDVQLTQMSAAPYGDAQTLKDVILRDYPHYVPGMINDVHLLWLKCYTQALGYRGTQARTLIREALSDYYGRTEEPTSYTAVDYFMMPGEGEAIPLWIEYNYFLDRIERIRVGKFVLHDIQF